MGCDRFEWVHCVLCLSRLSKGLQSLTSGWHRRSWSLTLLTPAPRVEAKPHCPASFSELSAGTSQIEHTKLEKSFLIYYDQLKIVIMVGIIKQNIKKALINKYYTQAMSCAYPLYFASSHDSWNTLLLGFLSNVLICIVLKNVSFTLIAL